MDIVPNIHLRPNLWLEFCHFIALAPADFLSIALPHVLPHLFATCNQMVLIKLEKELDRKVYSLLINEAPQILAHVLMLSDSSEITRALQFILGTLTEAANNVEIKISNFVKSCLVPLLSNLVIAMGDEDRSRANLVWILTLICEYYVPYKRILRVAVPLKWFMNILQTSCPGLSRRTLTTLAVS